MKKHSLKSFKSFLQSANCNVVQIFVSTEINCYTNKSLNSYAAIIYSGVPGKYVFAYKFKRMNEPFIDRSTRSFNDCIDEVNYLLSH